MTTGPRIALIHATPVAIDPIRSTLTRDWPEADAVNILEDSLAPDRAAAGEMTEALAERIIGLARYARGIGSDAILFTCSAFGSAIDAAAGMLDVPVLKPNEAMFEAAIRRGGRSAMIYTFEPARAGMEQEFRDEALRLDPTATLTSYFAPGASEALRAGDVDTHNRVVAEIAAGLTGCDSIVLAHFSTSRALPSVAAVSAIPALSSPDAAVAKLKRLLSV